jgi:hypothetical protein
MFPHTFGLSPPRGLVSHGREGVCPRHLAAGRGVVQSFRRRVVYTISDSPYIVLLYSAASKTLFK